MESKKETEFTMNIRIENFPNLTEHISEAETHFGMKWYTVIKRIDNYWTITLFCVPVPKSIKCRNYSFHWKVVIVGPHLYRLEPKTIVKCAPGGVQANTGPLTFNHSVQKLMAGDFVTVALTVQFFSSVVPPSFDFSVHSDELRSDVVLLVDDREFHVNKSFLSMFSTVFSAMFSERYKESTCSRIPIEDVDGDAFQWLLEVLYHKTDVTSENVEDLLCLANYFDFKDIKNKCEQVLVECSDEHVTLYKKLRLADQYMLQELMQCCMEEIKSVSQLQEVTPKNVSVLNPKTVSLLLQKMVDLPKAPLERPVNTSEVSFADFLRSL